MTVIAAIIDRQHHRAWMGSDSLATSGSTCIQVAGKITRLGAALVGTCGVPSGDRYLRGLEPGHHLPATSSHDGAQAWVDRLAGNWRAWAREQGLADKDTGHVQWWATIATPWGLWHIGSDCSVIEIGGDYTAEGSGAGPALGVLHFLARPFMGSVGDGEGYCIHPEEPDTGLRLAIEAAIAHGDGCGGPVRIEIAEAT